jgi:hypothetical protein
MAGSSLRAAAAAVRTRLLGSARTRILLSFLVLLALSTLVSTLALRQILLGRVGERVEQALVQEVNEFRTLAGIGRDPRTSRDFTDLTAVFDVYLERNVPSAGEALFTFAAGRLYRTTASPITSRRLVEQVPSLGAVTDTERGDVVTRDGTVRYLAVPVVFEGEEGGGAFAVTQNLGQEQAEVDQAVQVAAASPWRSWRSRRSWPTSWRAACSRRSTTSRRPRGRSRRPISPAASPCRATTSSPGPRARSTRCSTASSRRSTPSARSSPTRATSCARRSR